MERQQSRRPDAFRMSWLGWFLVALAILFLGSLLIPPFERSDGPAVLIRFQSFGLIAIPLAIWVGALAAQWRKPLYWAFVAMFAVVQLNSGFMAVGEYLLAYALVALSAAMLLRDVRPAVPATGRSSRRRPAARCR